MPNPLPIKKLEAAIRHAVAILPAKMGAETLRFFNESFRKQGWLGATFQPWPKRIVGGKKSSGRAILVKSGRLRRSPRVVRATRDSIIIATDVPYAQAHNEGFRGTVNVKAHNRQKFESRKVGTGKLTKTGKERMRTVRSVSGASQVKAHTRYMRFPRRQFMGSSPYLTRNLQRLVAAELMRASRSV